MLRTIFQADFIFKDKQLTISDKMKYLMPIMIYLILFLMYLILFQMYLILFLMFLILFLMYLILFLKFLILFLMLRSYIDLLRSEGSVMMNISKIFFFSHLEVGLILYDLEKLQWLEEFQRCIIINEKWNLSSLCS